MGNFEDLLNKEKEAGLINAGLITIQFDTQRGLLEARKFFEYLAAHAIEFKRGGFGEICMKSSGLKALSNEAREIFEQYRANGLVTVTENGCFRSTEKETARYGRALV